MISLGSSTRNVISHTLCSKGQATKFQLMCQKLFVLFCHRSNCQIYLLDVSLSIFRHLFSSENSYSVTIPLAYLTNRVSWAEKSQRWREISFPVEASSITVMGPLLPVQWPLAKRLHRGLHFWLPQLWPQRQLLAVQHSKSQTEGWEVLWLRMGRLVSIFDTARFFGRDAQLHIVLVPDPIYIIGHLHGPWTTVLPIMIPIADRYQGRSRYLLATTHHRAFFRQ